MKPSDPQRSGSSVRRRIVATYPYCDERRALLYESVRRKPKDFKLRRPDGKGGWRWSLDGVKRVPYRLAELREAIGRGETAYVVEGEKDVHALVERGLCATTSAGGAGWPWTEAFVEYFRDVSRIVIVADCDEPGRVAANARAKLLASVCHDVRVIDLAADRSDGYDLSDWFAEGHIVDELATRIDGTPGIGPAVENGAALLDAISAAYRKYLAVPKHYAETMAIYVLHSHAFEAATTTPYPYFRSPEAECGKTLALELLEHLCRRGEILTNVTPATLFRLIDAELPTLCIDELDTIYGRHPSERNEDLRAIINWASGAASAYRAVSRRRLKP